MIQFVVRSSWPEESVARRVAAIIGEINPWAMDSQLPHKRDGKWQLDSANDWFMERVGETPVYELRHRYNSVNAQKALDGLKEFLIYTFE